MFGEYVKTGRMVIYTSDININNWQEYYDGILNMMKDGIETDFLQQTFITVDFGDNDIVEMSIFDLYFNMIHWYLIVRVNQQVTGKHLYFNKSITQDNIKAFIDKHFVDIVRKTIDSIYMNNTIDDTLYNFIDVDLFSMYIANTINLEDDIALMNACPEYDAIMHTTVPPNTPIEEVKDYGMKKAERAIDIIVNESKKYLGYHHCTRDAFMSKEGINKRQYKEYGVHVGSKPNGQGGVHPAIIDGSYIQGALNSVLAQFIDSSASRIAQIQMKNNVGYSGNFARILGLNNIDTRLYDDPTYDCHSNNYQILEIKNESILNLLLDRYYRFHPNGQEFIITSKDTFLVGRTIYLRSPMTCASNARGSGVCYKCYGDLGYTNNNIKIGKYAAENLSSELTQRQLSAKHLLETLIKAMNWTKEFHNIFTVNVNILQLNNKIDFPKGSYLIIDPANIGYDNEDDFKKTNYLQEDDDDDEEDAVMDANYNKYITELYIELPKGERICITTENENGIPDPMYISTDFDPFLRKAELTDDDMLQIDLNALSKEEIPLFFIKLRNNELSKTLDDIQNVINKKIDPKLKKANPEKYTRHAILQTLLEHVIEGKLHIMGVHLEILLMNQLRSDENILEFPDWDIPDVPYKLIPLNQALTDNPSVTISMLYQNLSKALYYPLTYKKTKPSNMDLFFMKQPQNYLSDMTNIVDDNPTRENFCPVVRHRVHK